MTKKCVETIGFFDENIHPAYFEDDDYDRRINYFNMSIGIFNFNGFHLGSGTIINLSDNDKKKMNAFFELNRNYFYDKIIKNDFTQSKFNFNERSKKIFKIK